MYAEPGIPLEALAAPDREVVAFHALNLFFGGVQAVQRRDGELLGAGDPRRGGVAVRAEGTRSAAVARWSWWAASRAEGHAPDLFVVTPGRWGEAAGQRRRWVHCNGGLPTSERPPADPGAGVTEELRSLIQAPLAAPARIGVPLPRARRRRRALRRQLPGQPSALHHLQYLVLEVAQRVCGLPGVSPTRSAPCRWSARVPGRARPAPSA